MASADFLNRSSRDFQDLPRARPEALRDKSIFLPPIAGASTRKRLLVAGFAKMCLLTLSFLPHMHFLFISTGFCSAKATSWLVANNVHWTFSSRSAPISASFTENHTSASLSTSPCDLLTGFSNSPARDLHPLEILCSYTQLFVAVDKIICIFAFYSKLSSGCTAAYAGHTQHIYIRAELSVYERHTDLHRKIR